MLRKVFVKIATSPTEQTETDYASVKNFREYKPQKDLLIYLNN